MALPIGAKPIGKHQIKTIKLSEIARNRPVQPVGEPVFINIDHEAMARSGALRCLSNECRIGATLSMEALGLIGIVDENVGINPGNSLENSWSVVLAVVDANKYIFES